jgi:hypothetical protein
MAQPAPLFGGIEVSFYNITGVGIIEIIAGTPESKNPTENLCKIQSSPV